MKKDVPLCINFLTKKTPYKGLCADSGEKHEPASDIDAAVVDSPKALDPSRPIREADSKRTSREVRDGPICDIGLYSITATADASGLQLIEIRETFHDL